MDKKELVQALNQPHDVTVVSVSHITYSIDKSEKLFEGDTVTITVTPETHYQLLASGVAIVTSAGTNITFNYSGNRITFTMPNDDVQVTLTATALPTYSVTLQFTGSAGSSSIWASKTTGIYEGETITVNVSPASHFNISGWSSSPSVSFSGSGNSRSFVMPNSNVTVSVAMVEDPKYNITTSASGGSVSVSKTSAYAGETITVRMSPNAYYAYQSLSVTTTSGSGVNVSYNNGSVATFVMPSSNVRVSATFVAGYDFMIYVGRGEYDGDTYTGYISYTWLPLGNTQGSFEGRYLWDNATYKIPGNNFYTRNDWAPNPNFILDFEVNTTTTMPSGVCIDIRRVDTGKTMTLRGNLNQHSFMTSKDLGGEGFYPTQSDVGKWIPYKVVRGMYRI